MLRHASSIRGHGLPVLPFSPPAGIALLSVALASCSGAGPTASFSSSIALQAAAQGQSVTLTWSNPGASGFTVFVSSVPNCQLQTIAACAGGAALPAASSPVNVSGLRPGQPYYFVVSGVAPGGAAIRSNEASAELASSALAANGAILTMAAVNNTVYVGGNFTALGTPSGGAVPLSVASGLLTSPDFPVVEGTVYATAPDGNGGWFLGGGFTQVGPVARNALAHVLANGALDPKFDPNVAGQVYALVATSGVLYVGGTFTAIGGAPHRSLAALDAVTGTALPLNLDVSGDIGPAVLALTLGKGILYAGGSFTYAADSLRNGVAAFDAGTGAVLPLNPGPGYTITALALTGNYLVIGATPGTSPVLLSVDVNTGTVYPYCTGCVDGTVTALAALGKVLYVAGTFTHIAQFPRNGLAALDADTLAVLPWNPGIQWDRDAAFQTAALAGAGDTLYVGGTFTSVAGVTRAGLAAIDAGSGEVRPWNPASGAATALAVSGDTVLAGGTSLLADGAARIKLAAIDAATNSLLPWNPTADQGPAALAVSGNTVYVGGSFTRVDGEPRSYLAAVDAGSGALLPWSPNPQFTLQGITAGGAVAALAVADGKVFVGGAISSIGGQPHQGLAAVDAGSGAALPWNLDADIYPNAFAVSGNTVYVGGSFTTVAGTRRNGAAAVNASTGVVLPWNPHPNSSIEALALSRSTLYAGGLFTAVNGESRPYLAAVDAGSGADLPWNPGPDLDVDGIVIDGASIYLGGHFDNLGGTARNHLAAVDATTGALLPWNPNLNLPSYGSAVPLAVAANKVYAVDLDGSLYVIDATTGELVP